MKCDAGPLAWVFLVLGAALCQAGVKVEETAVTLPTYPPGPCDKNPVFYTGRVYQGAQGRIYSYPLCDVLRDEKVDKTYTSLVLANEYLEMSVLPEVGGRVDEAKSGYAAALRERPAMLWAKGMQGE